jgi:hypothetical protein
MFCLSRFKLSFLNRLVTPGLAAPIPDLWRWVPPQNSIDVWAPAGPVGSCSRVVTGIPIETTRTGSERKKQIDSGFFSS